MSQASKGSRPGATSRSRRTTPRGRVRRGRRDAGAGRGPAAAARPLRPPGELLERARRRDRGRRGAGDRGHARRQQRRPARPGAPAGSARRSRRCRSDGVRDARLGDRDLRRARRRPASPCDRAERFRRHAVAVRIGAERIGERGAAAAARRARGRGPRPRRRQARARPALRRPAGGRARRDESPDDRARRERREFGIDHALVGAVLVRRWGLPTDRRRGGRAPPRAGRHRPRRGDQARRHDRPPRRRRSGRGRGDARCRPPPLELDDDGAQRAAVRVPARRRARADGRPSRARSRSARSTRCAGSAEGKVYKQIAQELSLSVSTVRTHLHNVYRKIGAIDRAQAVLIARDRGWL